MDQEIAVTVDADLSFTLPPDVAQEDPADLIRKQLEDSNAALEAEKRQRASAEAARAEADRRAAAAAAEAEAARSEVTQTQSEAIETGLAAAEAAKVAAKAAYKQALEAGDMDAATDANDRLSIANAEILRLREGKADVEARKHERPAPAAPSDPVEAIARTMAPKAAAWVRSHPDYITDRSKNYKLQAAHANALGDGMVEGSDAYFEHVETALGMRGAPEVVNQQQQAPRRSAAPPVAPVNGGGAAPTIHNGPTEVRLTQAEALAAQDGTHQWNYDDPTGQKRWRKGDPIGVKEFARRKMLMKQQGLYDRSALEQ